MFTTDLQKIYELVDQFDPTAYARTRNHIRGAVSRLSPYISRGVISTRAIRDNLLKRGFDLSKIEKFMQELAWRDHWQQIWIAKGTAINTDLRQAQLLVDHDRIPKAIVEARTGIEAIDRSIVELYSTGYMHNHLRMYLAAVACNFGHSHWRAPAQWHYYHLLDGDWASNALSWQWVAGSNAGKKYIADQTNVDRYTDTDQKDTFLSGAYDRYPDMAVPNVLRETVSLDLKTPLPNIVAIELNKALPTYIYNWYNLDPAWDHECKANRILLLEPSTFATYPISQKSMDFMLGLAQNIPGIQVAVCEFSELANVDPAMQFHFKEHPLNDNYKGQEHPREWLSSIRGEHPSFFAFWKKAHKEILAPTDFTQ